MRWYRRSLGPSRIAALLVAIYVACGLYMWIDHRPVARIAGWFAVGAAYWATVAIVRRHGKAEQLGHGRRSSRALEYLWWLA